MPWTRLGASRVELQAGQGHGTSGLEAEDAVHANPSVITAESKLIAAEVHRAPHKDLIISGVTETPPLAPFVIEISLFPRPFNRGGESRRWKDRHTG